jgi:hypothetical protein
LWAELMVLPRNVLPVASSWAFLMAGGKCNRYSYTTNGTMVVKIWQQI